VTIKERILAAVQRMPDDVSYDDAIDTLYLLRKLEAAIAQADAGDVMDHDEFMAELENEEQAANRLDG
jgi:hypothetical protein